MTNCLTFSKLSYMVLAGLLFVVGCEDGILNEKIVEDNYVKIFMNQSDEDILAIDIKAIDNDSYLVFGICGNSLESKFDGNGKLYLLNINSEGSINWDTCISVSSVKSFPGNIIESGGGEFIMIWNVDFGSHKVVRIQAADHNSAEITINDLPEEENFGYINCITKSINPSDGYMMLSLGYQVQDATKIRKLFIIRADHEFNECKVLSQYEYDPFPVSGFSDNDLAFLKMVNNHLYLGHNGMNYFFNGPVGDLIVLMHAGDMSPVFSADDYWMTAIENQENDTINCLLTNPGSVGSVTYYVKQMNLDPDHKTVEDINNKFYTKELISFNTSKKICILQDFIAGTSFSGQVLIQDTQINDGLFVTLGEQYPYEVAGVTKDRNGNLLITGTTRLHNINQRIFLIRYAK